MLSQPLRASHFLNVEILHAYIVSPFYGSALIKFFCGGEASTLGSITRPLQPQCPGL